MNIVEQIIALLRKDILLEWRQGYALSGILLYVLCTVMTAYLAFHKAEPVVWLTLFWVILLFASVNAVAKSFIQESAGRQLYYYSLVSPQAVIISKMIYNVLLLLGLTLVAIAAYCLVLGSPVRDWLWFLSALLLGSVAFSMCFTLMSAIAAKAGTSASLMPILSLPLMIPILALLIRVSKAAVTGITSSNMLKDVAVLLAIDAIMCVLSWVLFPYLWKD